LRIAFAISASIGSIVLSPPSIALPFQQNPSSYQSWLNQRKWEGGKRIRFRELSRCLRVNPEEVKEEYKARGVELTFNDRVYIERYACLSGYTETTSPLGTRVCSIKLIETTNKVGGLSNSEQETEIRFGECRWR
jgi:hypothetical protein